MGNPDHYDHGYVSAFYNIFALEILTMLTMTDSHNPWLFFTLKILTIVTMAVFLPTTNIFALEILTIMTMTDSQNLWLFFTLEILTIVTMAVFLPSTNIFALETPLTCPKRILGNSAQPVIQKNW